MLTANPRPPNNGFTFLLFYTYTKVPDIETSDFLMASSVIVAPLRVDGARLSNFNDERSGRWHGLITDSFRQHFEIH